MKKYELVLDNTVRLVEEGNTEPCCTLFRVRALIDFGDVKAGDLGGYIQSEKNLSQDGNAWVSDFGWVYGDAEVSGNAIVSEEATVCDNSKVSGNAEIYGISKVSGEAEIYGNVIVSGSTEVSGNAKLSGDKEVCVMPKWG